nr:hypothetical protein [Allorhodopirellula heiligendammensis]
MRILGGEDYEFSFANLQAILLALGNRPPNQKSRTR